MLKNRTKNLKTSAGSLGKWRTLKACPKKTFMDILAQKSEIKDHERTLKQREAMLIQKEADLTAWGDKLQHQDKSQAKSIAIKTPQNETIRAQQSEAFKGEAEKIEKLRVELEMKATKLMKQELLQNQKDQDLKDKEQDLQDQEKQLNLREKTVATKEGFLSTKEERIELKEQELKDRESELRQRDTLVGEREALFAEKESKFGEKEHIVSFKEQAVKDKDLQLVEKEQKLLDKEIDIAAKETELAANTKKYEERFEQIKKSLEAKEQNLIKIKEMALEEKLQVQNLAQTNLEQLKQKEAEILKREKEIAKFKEEASKRRESTLLPEQKVKKGVDPEMLEAYRKEVEKAFLYTKTDIKRVTGEYSKKGKLESPNNSFSEASGAALQEKERQKLAFDWFKSQLADKLSQYEQFLTGRMLELQSFLDPDSISKTSITKEQFLQQLMEPKSEDQTELNELRRTLQDRERDLDKKEDFFKRKEKDFLNKVWKFKQYVQKFNLNLQENTKKNQQDLENPTSIDEGLEGEGGEGKKSNDGSKSQQANNEKILPPNMNSNPGGFTEHLPE